MVVDVCHHTVGCNFVGIDGGDGCVWREAKSFHHKRQRLFVQNTLNIGRNGCDVQSGLFGGQRIGDIAAAVLRIHHHVDVLVIVLGGQCQ